MKRVILIVLSLAMLLTFGGCAVIDSTSMPSSTSANNNLPTETRALTFEEVVARAQESKEIQDAVAEEFDLLFYSIEWGYTELGSSFNNGYWIKLYGNISGYKDRSKTRYVGKQAFYASIRVCDDGTIDLSGVYD